MALQAHQKDYLKVRTLRSFFWRAFSILISILSFSTDNDKRPDSVTLSLDCKENDLDNKHRDSVEIKQERLNDLCTTDDEFNALSNAQPPLKKLRAEVVDAESNTTNSGESKISSKKSITSRSDCMSSSKF